MIPQGQGAGSSSALDLAPQLDLGLSALGLDLSPAQRQQLLDYLALVSRWNKVYNLTAVRDPAQMLTHHLLDSLAVVPPLRRELARMSAAGSGREAGGEAGVGQGALSGPAARVLDVGAGAGLPGVVIAIACPWVQVTCVDTVAKKAAFIQQVALGLRLSNLLSRHARVEDLSDPPFDVVTSRAFASLVDFTRLTAFHVKQPAGLWMAMKGKQPDDEIAALAAGPANPTPIQVTAIEPLTVPGLDEARCLVWMRPTAAAPR